MKRVFFLAAFVLCAGVVVAQEQEEKEWEPAYTEYYHHQPQIVTAGVGTAAPSDAIVLFDGTNLDEWISAIDGKPAPWAVKNGEMIVKGGTTDIMTKRYFGDCQLHIEWCAPEPAADEHGQGRGNSGIFIQGLYEVQVLDNYNNKTYSNGQAGSIYKQTPPLVNACRKPGEWQTYDILFKAPVFGVNGVLVKPACITVIHNGVVIQFNTEILGSSEFVGWPKYEVHGLLPLKLQDHGNPVRYRNIWIREL